MSIEQQKTEIIAGLRRALQKCQHYKQFSRRIRNTIESELPRYICSIQLAKNTADLDSVRVWGEGLKYDQGVYVSWATSSDWAKSFAEALDIADSSDYNECSADEQKLIPQLEALEQQVIKLQEEGVRKDPIFWVLPSAELQNRFRKLFP